MHRIAGRILTLTIAAGLISIAAACTSSTAEPTTEDSTPKKDSGKSSSDDDDDNDTKKDSGTSNDDEDEPKNCSSETTADTCADCCGYNEQIDELLFQGDQVYIGCACESTCGTACGTFCTDPEAEPSDACITCLDSQAIQNECGPAADEVCDKNAACKAFLECDDASGCLDKPFPDEQDGG